MPSCLEELFVDDVRAFRAPRKLGPLHDQPRDVFAKGNKLRLTAEGLRRVRGRASTGVSMGRGQRPSTVRVLRDGYLTVVLFATRFWEAA